MAKRKTGPSNSFGYQGSFGNPPKPTFTSPHNSFMGPGQTGSFGNPTTPGYTPPAPGPSASPVAPPPLDPAFLAEQAAAGRHLTLGNLTAGYQQATINNEYGYGSDKSNPYSQAKLLEESWKRSKLGTTNNYASSGQLHSGAYGRMQGENDRNYSIGVDRGTRDMNQALAGSQLGQLENTAQYGMGMTQADYDALLNAFRVKFGG